LPNKVLDITSRNNTDASIAKAKIQDQRSKIDRVRKIFLAVLIIIFLGGNYRKNVA
jgi:hypothetical protein